MSIRAYKVKNIEWESSPTFNINHDEAVMDIVGMDSLDMDCCGLLDVSLEKLEACLVSSAVAEDTKQDIRKDILEAKKKGDEYIQYYCF